MKKINQVRVSTTRTYRHKAFRAEQARRWREASSDPAARRIRARKAREKVVEGFTLGAALRAAGLTG